MASVLHLRWARAGLREEDMTLRIQRSTNDRFVIFLLSGRIQSEHIAELQSVFESADQRIILDLKEVKLVDREAVKFLMQGELAGVRLKNCPAYIREWIRRERGK